MAVARKKVYTPEQYLKLDEQSQTRHEFVNGEILDMSGGTLEHNRIAVNLTVAIQNAVRQAKKPCSVFAADLRVQIEKANAYTYPDIMVICGKIKHQAGRQDVVINPTLIIEILSDSTREYDHTRKFQMYRKLPSLQEYVMVEQNSVSVECFRRIESGLWVFQGYENLKDTMQLQSVELGIPLTTIYQDVQLDTK